MKKTRFVMLALAASAFALFGCGGGGSSGHDDVPADLSPGVFSVPSVLNIENATIPSPLGGASSQVNVTIDLRSEEHVLFTVQGSFPENDELDIQNMEVGMWQSMEHTSYHFAPFFIESLAEDDGIVVQCNNGYAGVGSRIFLRVTDRVDDGETITYSGTVESGVIYVCDQNKRIVNSQGGSEMYQTVIMLPGCRYTYRVPSSQEN